jgi:hypothetical protein
MRTTVKNVSLGGLVVLGSVGATLSPSAAPVSPSAAWLAGCWALQKGDRIVEESWMPERGGVMLGMSRTSVAGQVREHEFVVLRAAGSALEYHVLAGGQPEVVFRAASPSAREAVFENPAHDFPKRVGYRLVSPDSLEAWIDGGAAEGKKTTYPYHRVDCRAS